MPIALSARGAEQFDHPPGAGADIDQPADRLVAKRRGDRLLDLAFGDVERADAVPGRRHGPRNSAPRPRRGRRAPPRAARRRRRTRPARSASAHWSIASNKGSARAGVGKHQEHPAAFLAPRDEAASARMRTWRDTRGWLWPSNCANSPTDSSIDRSSARIRSRLGSASAWKSAESGESGDMKQTYKDIFICVNRRLCAAACLFFAANDDCAARRRRLLPRAGLTEFPGRPSLALPTRGDLAAACHARNGTIMKKVALTVAVLALGLAACESKTAERRREHRSRQRRRSRRRCRRQLGRQCARRRRQCRREHRRSDREHCRSDRQRRCATK